MLRLVPSDFAFLYAECERCTYLKLVRGIARPPLHLPGVFHVIDKQKKALFLSGEGIARIGATGFTPVPFPASIRSTPIQNPRLGLSAELRCHLDALWVHRDGWLLIPDLKTTAHTGKHLDRYLNQLHAYAYTVMHCVEPNALRAKMGLSIRTSLDVKEVALLCWNPDRANLTLTPGTSSLTGAWTLMRYPVDMEGFYRRIDELFELCAGPLPFYSSTCPYCAWAQKASISESEVLGTVEEDHHVEALIPPSRSTTGRPLVARSYK